MNKEQLVTSNDVLAIDWEIGWGNDPTISLVKGPARPEFRFWRKEVANYRKSMLYVALSSPYARFMIDSDHRGSGGDAVRITMTDGSPVTVDGPWSSRSSVVNMFLKASHHIKEVRSAPADAMLVSWISAHLPEDVVLVSEIDSNGEISYHPAPRPGTPLYAELGHLKPGVCRI